MLGLAVNLATKQAYNGEVIGVLKQFENVYIADSTTILLPDKLKDLHTGLGGTNADAAQFDPRMKAASSNCTITSQNVN